MAVASSDFTGVDLSRLPPPNVVEVLSYETLLAGWLASFQGKYTDYSAVLESDPAYKLLEVGAYQEMVLRQRINDAAQAVLIAYAQGGDLDNLAALMDVERYILTPADPLTGIAEVDEGDTALRQRVVLAPQSYSVAGPEGAYMFHALSADSDVRDISVDSPTPGTVLITVLANSGDGTPTATTLGNVTAKLGADTIRPMTDNVVVQAATILPFAVVAAPTFFPGAAHSVALAAAQAAVASYVADSRKLGRAITRDGLTGAIMVNGVENANLSSPAADILPTKQQAGNCTSIAITDGGTV